jgi:hypothetical protein
LTHVAAWQEKDTRTLRKVPMLNKVVKITNVLKKLVVKTSSIYEFLTSAHKKAKFVSLFTLLVKAVDNSGMFRIQSNNLHMGYP